jgi:hypothetical protein
VLEALFLMMDHLSPDSFNHMNGLRGLNIPANGVSVWEPLFYQMNPNNTIRIQAVQGEDIFSLSYSKDDSYIPAVNDGIPKNVAGSFQSSAKRNYTLRFDFRVEGTIDYSEIGHYTTNENGTLREIADDNGDKTQKDSEGKEVKVDSTKIDRERSASIISKLEEGLKDDDLTDTYIQNAIKEKKKDAKISIYNENLYPSVICNTLCLVDSPRTEMAFVRLKL